MTITECWVVTYSAWDNQFQEEFEVQTVFDTQTKAMQHAWRLEDDLADGIRMEKVLCGKPQADDIPF